MTWPSVEETKSYTGSDFFSYDITFDWKLRFSNRNWYFPCWREFRLKTEVRELKVTFFGIMSLPIDNWGFQTRIGIFPRDVTCIEKSRFSSRKWDFPVWRVSTNGGNVLESTMKPECPNDNGEQRLSTLSREKVIQYGSNDYVTCVYNMFTKRLFEYFIELLQWLENCELINALGITKMKNAICWPRAYKVPYEIGPSIVCRA